MHAREPTHTSSHTAELGMKGGVVAREAGGGGVGCRHQAAFHSQSLLAVDFVLAQPRVTPKSECMVKAITGDVMA